MPVVGVLHVGKSRTIAACRPVAVRDVICAALAVRPWALGGGLPLGISSSGVEGEKQKLSSGGVELVDGCRG